MKAAKPSSLREPEQSPAEDGHDALTFRVLDALYVELVSQLRAPLLTVA